MLAGPQLAAAGTATFATTQRVAGIIRPADVDQVQACVRIANRFGVALYPVSRGRNWGLGSRVPAHAGSVVLDLGRLDRIVDYNETLAYITVEPGVTFRQAFDFLRERGSRLRLAGIGGPPDASLIGNTVERGDGAGPLGDRLAHACGMEVVLPTGECVHTGLGRFPRAQAAAVHRYGVGPYVDGLFTQSNLGIVTRLTMWLMPEPRCGVPFRCSVKATGRLAGVLDRLRELVLDGILPQNSFRFWNAYKVLAAGRQFPWGVTGGRTPLRLQALNYAEPWTGHGVLMGQSRDHAEALRQLTAAALRDAVDAIEFADELEGIPVDAMGDSGDNVRSTYWRKKDLAPLVVDPDRDRCGVIWALPVFPLIGEIIVYALREVEDIVRAASFEPNLALSICSGRHATLFAALMYDRDVDGEDARAMECHDRILSRLGELGHLPVRLGIHSMEALPAPVDDYPEFMRRLRTALDPNGVLAPGRYDRG